MGHFDENMEQLSLILQKLDKESLPLSEIMKLHEEATDLLKKCTKALKTAEEKIES
jgi:exodeoxyribonuclease VII small subunit